MICDKITKCFIEASKCKNIEISRNSKIVVTENKSRYCLDNSSYYLVGKTHIDSGCINESNLKKCDYLFQFKNSKDEMIGIFIELKGTNFYRAIEQIDSTLKQYSSNFKKCYGRIVCSTGTRFKTTDPKYIALKIKLIDLKGNLKFYTNSAEEKIDIFEM